METFSALLAICAGNSPVSGEFSAQRPVTRHFNVFFDLHRNKRLSKQWWDLRRYRTNYDVTVKTKSDANDTIQEGMCKTDHSQNPRIYNIYKFIHPYITHIFWIEAENLF